MNLQPIRPPSPHILPGACTSCKGEVRCDNGFADLDGPPFRAYLCAGCASIALFPGPFREAVIDASWAEYRRIQEQHFVY